MIAAAKAASTLTSRSVAVTSVRPSATLSLVTKAANTASTNSLVADKQNKAQT